MLFPQNGKHAGLYYRLSRDELAGRESNSITNQKELLSRHAREQGWTIIDYYVDDGVSGTTFDRPGFNRLVQDAKDGKITIALCKDLSRLGRDYLEAASTRALYSRPSAAASSPSMTAWARPGKMTRWS